jgi:hypothetical protein
MRLSLRGKKLAINAMSAGAIALTAVVISWPVEDLNVIAERQAPAPNDEVDANQLGLSVTGPAKEDFDSLCRIALRRPLYDPPPPKPEVRQLPPLNVQLLGTILEGENSMAMVRTEQGKTEYRRVGESFGPADSPATVVEIQSDGVVVDRASERLTLRVNNERR